VIMSLVLVISIGFLVPKVAAQSDKYPKMAAMEAAQAPEQNHFSPRYSGRIPVQRANLNTRPYFSLASIKNLSARDS